MIALYLAAKPQLAIVNALQHLIVNKSCVSHIIARYRDTRREKKGINTSKVKRSDSIEIHAAVIEKLLIS